MERVFFVDYENVDTGGLDGLGKLNGNDAVYIYYSESHSRMTFGLHRRIMESVADFHYKKIRDDSKNALDNVLMEDADGVITDTRADYYIISKDKDYESFVKNKKKNGYRVFLLPDIKECNEIKLNWLKNTIRNRLVEDYRTHSRRYELDDKEIEKVARWIMDSNSKQELNNHLQEMFKNKEVKYIFTRLRDLTYNL